MIHQKNLIAPPFLLAEAAQLLVKSSLSPFLTPMKLCSLDARSGWETNQATFP